MAFNSTTGLGVAAQVLTTGNINVGVTKPGRNGIILSLSGTSGTSGYPSTFQLTPKIVDVSGAPVPVGSAFTLTAVAAASPAPYTLTAAAPGSPFGPEGLATTVYTGTITGGASNAYEGRLFTIAGFDLTGNNGTFECVASTATTLTLLNASGVSDTHAGTAQDQTATAVYTGTITGGASNAFAGFNFTIAGFVGANNNGTFYATASSATTVTLVNPAATAETHAATAQPDDALALTYVAYGSKGVTNTYLPSGTPTKVATVSATGLITAGVAGVTTVEASYPAFGQTGTTIVSSGNVMNGLPNSKVYSQINVKVIP